MWTKTITKKFKGVDTQVQIWLSDVNDEGKQIVKVQSMVNEYFLMEEILFEGRDKAHDFIKHYPVSMAVAFLQREAINEGAVG